MKEKIIFTILFIIFNRIFIYFIIPLIFGTGIGNEIIVNQLNGESIDNIVLKGIMEALIAFINILTILYIFKIWKENISKLIEKGIEKMGQYFIIIFCLLFVLNGCTPYPTPIVKEIKPNETAYLIPLEGDTKTQDKFQSSAYLEEKKVSAKRIIIPVRWLKTGRFYLDGKHIPSATLIIVDRSPITREWTSDNSRGTSNKNEGIELESKDSIGFSIGVNITTMIKEEDTSVFLYYYGGKSLNEITDQNIRGYIQSVLASEFGNYNLDEGKGKNKAINHFKQYGITIANLGMADGMNYTDEIIQKNLNDKFIAENEKEIAKQQQEKAIIENKTALLIQENKTALANEFKKAEEAQRARIELEIAMINANVKLKLADKWSGNVPSNVVPESSEFLFNFKKE